MIKAGVLAGAYSSLARTLPEAARGLEKMRAKWAGRAATLMADILADAGFEMASADERHAREG